jgi:XRE family transcriptional regulator, regulator of sulfur utilization
MNVDDLNQRLGRRVRARRVERGDSLGDVARASGLSKTILSKIESGDGNPSVETLWRLSQALGVPLGTLVEDDDEGPRTRLIRRGSGAALTADSGMGSWMIHAGSGRTELHEISLPAGTNHRSGAHLPGTEEVILCVSGRIEAGLDGAAEELEPGDAVWFVADGPHAYRSLGGDASALCWMLYASGAS